MSALPHRAGADALAALAADHRAVLRRLAEFDELVSAGASASLRQHLALQICQALTAHAIAAEDLVYPALRQALQGEDDDLVDDAEAGHDAIRALVEQVELMQATDERFDAMVFILGRAVVRHVQLEEGELFPRVQAAGVDLAHLGERFDRRRDEALLLLSEEG